MVPRRRAIHGTARYSDTSASRRYIGERAINLTPIQIGPYIVERELGRGGMGRVLLGRDERLGRLVAIKGVAADVAADPEQMTRLQREARLLASLNHPNIITIFAIEQQAGSTYIIMEYIEGPDLGDRLGMGTLAYAEAIDICLQVAMGTDAAHRAGVVHRDLKPANVKLGPDGRVKVLDFGLARAAMPMSTTPLGPSEREAATVSVSPMTMQGMILGTPGYMSPEQARGASLDRRADVFAFGCILYECLTGGRAFPGSNIADVIARTLTAEPAWDKLPQRMTPTLRELLEAALHKEPDARLADLAPMVQELQEVAATHRASGAPATARTARRLPAPNPWGTILGRLKERDQLFSMLRASPRVALIGSDGTGKTRLALDLIEAAPTQRFERAVYLNLASIANPSDESELPRMLSKALGGGGSRTIRSVADLSSKAPLARTLVVLDQCETAIKPALAFTSELTASTDAPRVLMVSRDSISELKAHSYKLPSMAIPPEDPPATAEDLLAYDSVRLFVERALDAQPEFDLTVTVRPAVFRLLRRLGGAPLAIEIAAARLRVMNATQMLAQLDAVMRPIAAESGGSLQRSQIISALVLWSFRMLAPREQAWMSRLAGIIGGFTLEDAVRVCAEDGGRLSPRDISELLQSLVQKRLVMSSPPDEPETTFGVHPAVREALIKHA